MRFFWSFGSDLLFGPPCIAPFAWKDFVALLRCFGSSLMKHWQNVPNLFIVSHRKLFLFRSWSQTFTSHCIICWKVCTLLDTVLFCPEHCRSEITACTVVPIFMKLEIHNYFPDTTPHAKFQGPMSTWVVWANSQFNAWKFLSFFLF